jgi:hypothetical protein
MREALNEVDVALQITHVPGIKTRRGHDEVRHRRYQQEDGHHRPDGEIEECFSAGLKGLRGRIVREEGRCAFDRVTVAQHQYDYCLCQMQSTHYHIEYP